MSYFDFMEELGIVNSATASIKGALDEWIDGVQCGDKLRHALMLEDDENYLEF